MRVGIGFDLHAFGDDPRRPLMLGGVAVPGARGLAGHSDADVLLHAACDALLGAMGQGDLGRHFPDSDPALKGVASLDLLRKVAGIMKREGYRLINLDAVVVTQEPRIAPHTGEMRRRIAEALGAGETQVCVKGTSPERIGGLGRGEGIAAQAVVLIGKI